LDITFDNLMPGQNPPVLGDSLPFIYPNDRLTRMNFGETRVVGNIPGMNKPIVLLPTTGISDNVNYSQPLVHESQGNTDPSSTYLFTMDLFLSGFQKRARASRSVDELGIFFDLPTVQRIDFTTDGSGGRVSVGAGIPTYVGSFDFDTVHRLWVFLDFINDHWSAGLDSGLLFADASFTSSGSEGPILSSLRINLTDDATLANVPTAYIDNLRLVSSPFEIPELPIECSALICGFLWALRRCVHAQGPLPSGRKTKAYRFDN
jgi:hypothetical protein